MAELFRRVPSIRGFLDLETATRRTTVSEDLASDRVIQIQNYRKTEPSELRFATNQPTLPKNVNLASSEREIQAWVL